MRRDVRHGSALGALALVLAAALLWAQPAGASTVYRLPRSDYTVRAACAAPAPGRAGCLALQLVPLTAEARAHTHPIGVARTTDVTTSGPPSPAASDFGVSPQDLHSAYGLPTSAPSVQTIALVDAYNDPSAEADLATYSQEFGLPECTAANGCFEQVNQDGKATELPFPKSTAELEAARKGTPKERAEAKDAIGWAVEISLDIETARAVCQNCHIALVEAESPSYPNLETAEDAAVGLGASEVSNSWAGPECAESECSPDSAAFNHPGVVITVAAGDEGYLNWLEEPRSPYANFPASSPQVVAVGGTRLETGPVGERDGESVWNDGGESVGVKDGHGAGGGGCSIQFEAQPWQREVADWSSVGCGDKRAVADVSADADPYTGVPVYDSSPGRECETVRGKSVIHWCTYGGTSVASPLIAATFALAGGANGVKYPAKTLYENAAKSPGSLYDVTEGSNGECLSPFDEETRLTGCTSTEEGQTSCDSQAICLARSGYDGPTGVGTPDGIAAFTPAPDAPAVASDAASPVTQTSATLNATVNPDGLEVSECQLEYGTAAVDESSVPCSPAPGAGTSPVAVSAALTGLPPNTTYRFRISATNKDGTSIGNEQVFTTLPYPPIATTGAASSPSPTSATLHGEVDPNGGEVTTCRLEYGTDAVGESSVPCSPPPGSGTEPVSVSARPTGLDANTAYRFRVSATNAGGTSVGGEQTFTTLPEAPTVTTSAASSITPTAATLHAEVNPNGEAVTECKLEYGTTTAYGSSAPCEAPPGPGNKLVAVAATLTGLTAATTYHFRIVATNAQGASKGNDETFATLLPTTLQQQVPDEQGTSNGHGVSDSQARKQPPVPDAELASVSLTASPSGTVIVRVSCPADESSCSGRVTLRTLSAVVAGAGAHQSKNAKAAILTLAIGSFKAAGGRVTTVRLRLSAKARALLARAHLLRARATVLAHDPAGATHTAQSVVTIRADKSPVSHKG
jgi:hypothetical protein